MESEIKSIMAEALECSESMLQSSTEFKSLPGWDSLAYLAVVGAIDESFGVVVTEQELNALNTIDELSRHVEDKKSI